MHIKDVVLTEEFIEDYINAPIIEQNKISQLLSTIGKHGVIPRGMNAHKARALSTDLWIGWVTRKRASWRVLFMLDDGILTCVRFLDHDTMDRLLKKWN